MKAVLVGYGEIGKAIKEVFKDYHEIEVCDPQYDMVAVQGNYAVLLVTMPYSKNFVEVVKDYQAEYKPKATIIFSTVAIGTTSQIPNAIHSPVEGKHPKLAESIELMPRWIGGYNETAHEFFTSAKFRNFVFCQKPEFTEFLKLRSTSKYGINIEFARYEKTVCDDLEMDYNLIKLFDRDYNALYNMLGLDRFQRYILDPPKGNIGGHCVVPNAMLLDEQYPSVLLKEIYSDKEALS